MIKRLQISIYFSPVVHNMYSSQYDFMNDVSSSRFTIDEWACQARLYTRTSFASQ